MRENRVALARSGLPTATVLSRAEHPISRTLISPNTLKVMYRLHRAGYLAYLVGGAVRDLLLGRVPKDFDVGTDARPQQVKQLFGNARIIGRRFRLARVQFADEVVEVSTFRRSREVENGVEEEADVLAPEGGEEDEYGSPEEDAFRRDFTINGLFYNIADFTVIDYVGGLHDLRARLIRSIGPPRERFLEDPVRMMRAVEYATRLGFAIEDETAAAMRELYREIRRASPARLAYELGESLQSGKAEGIFRSWAAYGLLGEILPFLSELDPAGGERFFELLAAADAARASGESFSQEALFSLLALPQLELPLQRAAFGQLPLGQLEAMIKEEVAKVAVPLAFSHYRGHLLRYGLFLLARLLPPPRSPRLVVRTLRHEAFPVAWEVLRLWALAGGVPAETVERWREMQERVKQGLEPLPGGRRPRPGRPRRARRKEGPRGV